MAIKIFTTRKENDENIIYGIIQQSISKYYKKKHKENVEWFYYSSLIDAKYLFPWLAIPRIIAFFFLSFFNKHYWLNYKYNNINIGRYAMSATFRDVDTVIKANKYYLSALINALKGVALIYRIERCNQNFDAFYIDHGMYLNGIFIEYASQKNKSIFTNDYPYGLTHRSTSKKLSFEDFIKIPFNNLKRSVCFDRDDLINNIPYMSKIPETDNEVNYKEIEVVVYTHSFTDAQITFGPNDAYINMYDWLCDVCKILSISGKKVLIKGHPNFYGDISATGTEMDKKLFNTIMEKYKTNSNLYFINKPLPNADILNSINKNTVLVSHHGNALIEGGILGFKCISSNNSLWKYFFNFNEFTTKEELSKVLLMHYSDLNVGPKEDAILNFLYTLKRSDFSYYSKKCWYSIIANNIGISQYDFIANPWLVEGIALEDIDKIVDEVSDSIHHINN
jgi:hypothetical protein